MFSGKIRQPVSLPDSRMHRSWVSGSLLKEGWAPTLQFAMGTTGPFSHPGDPLASPSGLCRQPSLWSVPGVGCFPTILPAETKGPILRALPEMLRFRDAIHLSVLDITLSPRRPLSSTLTGLMRSVQLFLRFPRNRTLSWLEVDSSVVRFLE